MLFRTDHALLGQMHDLLVFRAFIQAVVIAKHQQMAGQLDTNFELLHHFFVLLRSESLLSPLG